jgi:uncharacterized protein (TIGR00730 family)
VLRCAMHFHRVAVYCGSNVGRSDRYAEVAFAFGSFLAERNIGIVYGGGRVGLMGRLADGALSRGGEVIGVIPEKLRDLELAHTGVTRLEVVDGMHARKLRMSDLADAFVAMPGGYGTLEELFEVTTWTQLRYHVKPIGLLNVSGFWDHLLAFLDHAEGEGFIRGVHRGLIACDDDPARLLDAMGRIVVPDLGTWIEKP